MNYSSEIISLTEKYGANNYHPLSVVITKAEGVWVEDPEGNRYMDMLSAYSRLSIKLLFISLLALLSHTF